MSGSFSDLTGLTDRELAELFYAAEEIAAINCVDPFSFAEIYRSCMDQIIGAHVNCRCFGLDPLPAPPIPRNERFDDWRKRTAALLEECAKDRR